MLSRPGFNIRRLISQRRPRTADGCDGEAMDHDEIDSFKALNLDASPSWMASRTSNRRPSPKPIVVVRRSGDAHRISGPIPPLPDTPHSSTSSLCSCEYHHVPGRVAGSRSPRLCAGGPKTPDSKSHSSPSRSPRGGQSTPHSIRQRKGEMNSLPEPEEPALNFLEALSLSPERTSSRSASPAGQTTPRGPSLEKQHSGGMSDNVQQLIRETDEAFKSVGSALEEAKVASQDPRTLPSPVAISPTFIRPRKAPTTPTAAQPRSVLRKLPSHFPAQTRSPARRSSVSKTKRKRSKRSKRMEHTLKPPPAHKSSSRWTLTDNVAELFNGRLFNRIEADEMLTPSQLQELKANRMSRLQQVGKESTDTIRTTETEESDTPIEPFHLDDLPSRIGAAGVKLSAPSPIEEVPTPRSFDFDQDIVRQDFSAPKKEKKSPELSPTPLPIAPQTESNMTFKDVAFPAPPSKSPLRSTTPRKQLPPLPTIPEVVVTLDGASVVSVLPVGEKSDAFLYFTASPFSLTMPTMRHGPIRFAKADLCMEPKLPADETLDWTAFQMAILGGAGDFFSDSVDFGHTTELDEADDLQAWFADLGLATGGLETAHPPPERLPKSTFRAAKRERGRGRGRDRERKTPSPASSDRSGSTAKGPARTPVQEMVQAQRAASMLPIPVLADNASGFWNVEGAGSPLDAGRYLAAGSMGLRRWNGEGHPKRPAGVFAPPPLSGAHHRKRDKRASVESLPPSPMLDLVVSRGADGGEYVVPMGYNLGHDLGDFLRWESENVYATGWTD